MKQLTKDKILEAAKKLFVTHGFDGTSITEIAKLADVNHSLIFHHFKNKAQLWISVKQYIAKESNQQTKNIILDGLSWEDCLNQLFTQYIRFYRSHPDIIRMMNWQRLELNSTYNIRMMSSEGMQVWIELVKKYQRQGAIAEQHDPQMVVSLLLSIISSAALDSNVLLDQKQPLEKYIHFCIDITKKGLS